LLLYKQEKSSSYFPKIDGLRFVAIFFVLVAHFATYMGEPISAGYYGVDLFFVISGFLITSILLKTEKGRFKNNYFNFLGRRTLRIFPIYYLSLIILWILNLDTVRENIFSLLTYTWNYTLAKHQLSDSPVIHYWSLSVEEQFYLFWPLVILFVRKNRFLLTTLVCLIVITGYAQILFNIFPSLSLYNQFGLLTRMSSLGMGALGAIASLNWTLPTKVFKSKHVECAVLFLLFVSLIIVHPIKFVIMGVCSIFFVIKSAYFPFSTKCFNSFLLNKRIIYIGTISYGIYLYHIPIAYYIDRYLFDPIWNQIDFASLGFFRKLEFHPWVFKFPINTSVTIVFAIMSYKYLEKPILSLKSRWFTYKESNLQR